jgi:hypothetical protein
MELQGLRFVITHPVSFTLPLFPITKELSILSPIVLPQLLTFTLCLKAQTQTKQESETTSLVEISQEKPKIP